MVNKLDNILKSTQVNSRMNNPFNSRIWHVEIAELVISAIVVYLAIMMLAFAIVVSKRTRGRKHRSIQEGCLMGGRRTASFFLWTTFVLLFFWILYTLLLAIPNVAWCMIASVCEHELEGVYTGPGVRRPGFHQNNIPLRPFWEEPDFRPPERPRWETTTYGRQSLPVPSPIGAGVGVPSVLAKANESLVAQLGIGRTESFYYVFNLTAYGIYIQPWKYPEFLNIQETITTQARFKIFCSAIKTAGSLYGCGLGGAFLVDIGLSLFMIVMASYKTRLKMLKELSEYKQAASFRRSNDNVNSL
nr:myelin proteolipid [Hymenolepis microstoma]